MIPYKQRFAHDPDNGKYGDCHRTCIASLLDLKPGDVPHFFDKDISVEEANRMQTEFLGQRGLHPVCLAYECDLERLMSSMKTMMPDTYYILGGTSKFGGGHSVVCCGGEIVHDPSGSGIVGPMEDGYFWITLFLSNKMKKEPWHG